MRPFTVLHVCLGNICRSPMAERLLLLRLEDSLGTAAGELVHSHSVGTGDWHVGEPMNPSAASQIRRRGGDPSGFVVRQLASEHLDESGLILAAAFSHYRQVLRMRPEVADKTFLLLEFGQLMTKVDTSALPEFAPTIPAIAERGRALVSAANALRDGRPLSPADELDDPWGLDEATFSRVADEIDEALGAFVAALTAS